MLRVLGLILVTSCFSGQSTGLATRLEPLAWMLGDWRNERNTTSVVGGRDTIYLVNFETDGASYDVKLIDNTPTGLVLFHPMDERPADRATKVRPARVTFAGAGKSTTTFDHAPRSKRDDGTISDSLQYSASGVLIVELRRFRGDRATVVERADLELALATRDHGSSSWAAGFVDEGAIWTAADGWLRGRVAIEHALSATNTFSWEPSDSRLAPNGKMALTTGRFTRRSPDGRVEQGSYLSIWKLTAKQQWRVVFSTRQAG